MIIIHIHKIATKINWGNLCDTKQYLAQVSSQDIIFIINESWITEYEQSNTSWQLNNSSLGETIFSQKILYQNKFWFSSDQSLSCVQLCNPMDWSMAGFPVHHQLPGLAQTHVCWVSDANQPFHPLLSPSPAFYLSQHQGLFQGVSTSHQVAKVLELQFSISLSNEHPGLISFRMDWLDLLAVQGTLKSLLQHHSSNASIFWYSAFFIVQLSHPYLMALKKKINIASNRQTFVGKVMSLLFNMLSRFVMVFIPRIKHLLISWLQSPSAVILEPPKIKSDTLSTVSPSVSHEVIGPDAMK